MAASFCISAAREYWVAASEAERLMAARRVGSEASWRMAEASASGSEGSTQRAKPRWVPSVATSGVFRGDSDDGLACGEDAEHFAGGNDALKTGLDGDDVGVGGGEDGGDFGGGKKMQEADISCASGQRFEAGALGSITDEHQANVVVFELARGGDEGVPGAVKT